MCRTKKQLLNHPAIGAKRDRRFPWAQCSDSIKLTLGKKMKKQWMTQLFLQMRRD